MNFASRTRFGLTRRMAAPAGTVLLSFLWCHPFPPLSHPTPHVAPVPASLEVWRSTSSGSFPSVMAKMRALYCAMVSVLMSCPDSVESLSLERILALESADERDRCYVVSFVSDLRPTNYIEECRCRSSDERPL
jgi:hypothetical protein